MSKFLAALPMYDWPEAREETDLQWAQFRDKLQAAGFDVPETLARRNADMPALQGGVRDADGIAVAPDPASLPPNELDLPALWRHPKLLLAQACWGPMEFGLAPFVEVVGQPDYSGFEGGDGIFYSSAILMRRGREHAATTPSSEGGAVLPTGLLLGMRFAFNGRDSMSGYLALERDLGSTGKDISIFTEMIETGGHRTSIRAVAEGRADVCAVDCRSWAMAKRFEPAADALVPVGWTARRKGLPYIASASLPRGMIAAVRIAVGSGRIDA